MVEISQPSPGSFISNLDKHRGTRLPLTIDDDLCLETGIDLGDGAHIVFKPGMRHSSYIYSISQRYPDEWFGGRFVLYPPPIDRKSTRLNSSHANLVCRLLLEK